MNRAILFRSNSKKKLACSFRREKVAYCLCEPEKDLVIIVFETKFLPKAEKRVAILVFIA